MFFQLYQQEVTYIYILQTMMKVYPIAKINLGLNVVNKRPDGYHDLETVFYPIGITDELMIEEGGNDCSLSIDGLSIEGSVENNLVVRAYRAVKERCPHLPPVNITLKKRIPMQAGMGGGSADCAYTITALNTMFQLGLDEQEMRSMAKSLGADCPFFINPTPAYATGIGEKLSPIPLQLDNYHIAIVKPPLAISTKEAFAGITPKHPAKCCREIVAQPIETWKDELKNDFEESIAPQHPEIADIKQRLYDKGAVYAAMSGSGSALFGIFKESPANLQESFNDCFTAIVKQNG